MSYLDQPAPERQGGSRAVSTDDLLGNFHFLLEVEGYEHGTREIIAGFQQIDGGQVRISARDISDGESPAAACAPGRISFDNLRLSRGLTRNRDLLQWMDAVLSGKDDRRSGSIVVLDPDGSEVRRFHFYEAFPVAWSGPALDAAQSSVAVERFELALGSARWG